MLEGRVNRRTVLGFAAVAGATAATGRSGAMPQAGGAVATPTDGGVRLDARVIYPPRSISEQARTYLARRADAPVETLPPATDKDAWRRYVVQHDLRMFPPNVTPRLPASTLRRA